MSDSGGSEAASALTALVNERSVIVCCGSGGVGKTTVSAIFALAAARAGRRACVVTVDPARRLADSLGIESLPNEPTEVEGDWPGHLHALMLDTKGTFDDLIHTYSGTPEQAEGILSNRLYQNLAGALSGTQEYMAMEKLNELVESGQFDVVVVDTPPTRNALDLLDAPRRLTRFLENRIFRALLFPTRVSLRAVGLATSAFLRTVSKVAGAEIVQDAIAFFQAFDGMEEGFRARASAVRELLADPTTAYVLVTSARPDAITEAKFFAEKLAERDISPAALVVNRIQPRFGAPDAEPPGSSGPLAALAANLAALNDVARQEESSYAALAADVAPAVLGRIPLFGQDVHDLGGLQRAADVLFG
jgi:anion-transporting  ArsA/GET3 family ATPase